MKQSELFNNEKIISQSDGDLITLTNYRIRYTDKELGHAYIVSILLKNISSIQIRFKSRLYLLLIAILEIAITFGVLANSDNGYEFIIGIVIGVILLSVFFASRKHYLTISSKGGHKINFFTKGMKQESIIDFVNRVEKAMLNNH